jgi:hypothetical protein
MEDEDELHLPANAAGPRSTRKIPLSMEKMSESHLRRIAANRMDPEHAPLDALMDE